MVIARPGKNTSHQCGTSDVREPASILPQVGVGGGIPTPKKPSAAAMMMATPKCVVARMRYGATHWGRIGLAMILNGEDPIARAASTYAISLSDRATARTIRPAKRIRGMAIDTTTAPW